MTKPNQFFQNFAANGTNVDVDMIMVRCLRIVMSDIASSIDVKLIGPISKYKQTSHVLLCRTVYYVINIIEEKLICFKA